MKAILVWLIYGMHNKCTRAAKMILNSCNAGNNIDNGQSAFLSHKTTFKSSFLSWKHEGTGRSSDF